MTQINEFLDYPKLFPGDSVLFNNLYCYIIKQYKLSGIALYVGFREGSVYVRFADWFSAEIDIKNDKSIESYLQKLPALVTLLKSSGINDICLYFSDGVLVDAMLSANKFFGPGMLRDVFGKIFKTQEVIEIAVVNKEKIENSKGCIIKPSRFRFAMEGNTPVPLYGSING